MRSKGGQISIAMVCLVLGIMLSIQFKTSENYGTELRGTRVEDLTVKLDNVTSERDSLAKEVVSLRSKITNIRSNDTAMADLQDDLQKSNTAAGLLPASCPGVVVTLNDNPRPLQSGENPNDSLVHDEDLLKVVNEMRASGAEAISINDERVTALSEIRCAGTTILVNTNKIAPPFIIKAVGDANMLDNRLLLKSSWLETLKQWGLQVQVQKSEKISIPAFKGALQFKYSSPVQ